MLHSKEIPETSYASLEQEIALGEVSKIAL
jgi:hypothetical protein